MDHRMFIDICVQLLEEIVTWGNRQGAIHTTSQLCQELFCQRVTDSCTSPKGPQTL
jgi:hypothetical protein